MQNPEYILLFDGVCNLCNGAVQFIIRRDPAMKFRFASLQSEAGLELAQERGIDLETTDSMILIEPGTAYYTRSDAALKIGKSFGGAWKLLGIFEGVPRPIRDGIYNWVARNRYKWFGKREACMIPTPELRSRFL